MDKISRIICDELDLRAYAVTSLDTAREITRIHNTSVNATVAMGRAVASTALLSATLKPESDQTITMKFSGDGPLKELHIQADARGNLRGYVSNPRPDDTEDLGGLNFSRAIGAGFLSIIRDLGLREPYTSTMPLMYGDIARDISYFLASSEQVPSALLLGLELDREGIISASGGILIQTFPHTPASSIEIVEKAIQSMKIPLGHALLEGADIHSIVSELMGNRPLEISSENSLRAKCRCSREMLKSAFSGIQEEELLLMIEEDHGAEVTCTFCSRVYHFSEDELRNILKKNSTAG
jgi:molecular chaperone Hsp33